MGYKTGNVLEWPSLKRDFFFQNPDTVVVVKRVVRSLLTFFRENTQHKQDYNNEVNCWKMTVLLFGKIFPLY